MKTGKLLFCFLCLLLIVTSIYHLRLYSICSNKNADLRQVLLRNDVSNKILNKKVNNLETKTRYLRNISAHKLVDNRNMAKSSNALGKSASNLIIALQNKINEHDSVNDEIPVAQSKNVQLPLSKQHYLLIEPQTIV